MTTELLLRHATPDDAEVVAGLLNPIILNRDGTALTETVTIREEQTYLQGHLIHGWVILASQSGEALGFQSVQVNVTGFGEIGTYIAADARGQGVGRSLTAFTAQTMRERGVHTLLAEVATHNVRGLRAYRSWGFRDASPELIQRLRGEAPEDKTCLEYAQGT